MRREWRKKWVVTEARRREEVRESERVSRGGGYGRMGGLEASRGRGRVT